MALLPETFLNIIAMGRVIMFDDDDDDDYHKEEIPKVFDFAEETVACFCSNQFKTHFRISPETFDILLGYVANVTMEEDLPLRGQQEIALDKQLMITMWYLANIESFRSVASRFNISKSTCWNVLRRMANRILNCNRTYEILKWPDREKAEQTMRAFENRNHFPGIIGCIDGSHIKILRPSQFPNSYYNRKKFHSVILQAVCNEKKLFIDVYAGQPGSMHDASVFRRSDLYKSIRNRDISLPNNGHLLGDLAYPLAPYLLVGFKNLGNLTAREINFNKKLATNRVLIENAFAELKGRFRRLKFMETRKLDLISVFIVISAILHNVCILNNDLPDDIMVVQNEILEEHRNNVILHDLEQIDDNAIQKRLNIMYNLPDL